MHYKLVHPHGDAFVSYSIVKKTLQIYIITGVNTVMIQIDDRLKRVKIMSMESGSTKYLHIIFWEEK